MRRFDKKKNMEQANILLEQRRLIEMGVKTIPLKKLVSIARNAGDIVPDAMVALHDLGTAYGEQIPLQKVVATLANFDIELSDVNHKAAKRSGSLSIDQLADMGLLEGGETPLDIYGKHEWWKNNPDKLLSYVYWTKKQVPPTDPQKRSEAYKDIVNQLNSKFPAPPEELAKHSIQHEGLNENELTEDTTPTFIKLIKSAERDGHIKGMETSAQYIVSAAKEIGTAFDGLALNEKPVLRDKYYNLFLKKINKLNENELTSKYTTLLDMYKNASREERVNLKPQLEKAAGALGITLDLSK